ncbi:MAG: sulfotransferase [Deltaproteobacteria bacterium]|nr:sulfotransferase [Deltaproteobacteria bacterium]
MDSIKRPLAPSLLKRLNYTARTLGRMIFCRIPLTSPPGRLTCIPFFIVGSGRSGNTLLRAMLAQHPEVAIPPESYVLPAVVRKFYQHNYLTWQDLVVLVTAAFENHPLFFTWGLDLREFYKRAIKIDRRERSLAKLIDLLYSYYAEKKEPGARRWGDKTPLNSLNLERLNWVFPQARYVHIVRDGRDVVLSYLEAGIYADIEDASKRWLRSVARAGAFGTRIGRGRYLEITYEDLVQNSEKTLERVCSFLDLNYIPAMMDFWRSADRLGDSVLPHHENLKRPVTTESIGRWRHGLDPGQQARIKKLLGVKLRELGYADL